MSHMVHGAEYTIFIFSLLGRVNENVYANHNASETSSRSGMSASLIIIMISGRSNEMSLKSICS